MVPMLQTSAFPSFLRLYEQIWRPYSLPYSVQHYIDRYSAKTSQTLKFRLARPPCSWCGLVVRGGPALRRRRYCALCEAAHFCTRECQMAAWEGGHWNECGPATVFCAPRDLSDGAVEEAA